MPPSKQLLRPFSPIRCALYTDRWSLVRSSHRLKLHLDVQCIGIDLSSWPLIGDLTLAMLRRHLRLATILFDIGIQVGVPETFDSSRDTQNGTPAHPRDR